YSNHDSDDTPSTVAYKHLFLSSIFTAVELLDSGISSSFTIIFICELKQNKNLSKNFNIE
ncbi:hypothetical protein B6V01_004820, partial [Methanosarcinales archaeon ex4572_44]